MDELFNVEIGGEHGASLRGELDLSSYDVAARALTPLFQPGGEVTLDMSGLSFIDSTGIRLLVQLHQALGDNGRLTLRSPSPQLSRILEITGIAQLGIGIDASAG
ncbi:MAG TPA: STAS domain-containing protein [Actinomycetota bacterium]|jgi:anti-anti-sigma factor